MRPRLIVIAGPNGAGKTTFTERVLAHQWLAGCHYVNPDLIANERFGGWNEPSAILQAAQEADRLRESCLAEGLSLAFETVSSSAARSLCGFWFRGLVALCSLRPVARLALTSQEIES